MQQYHDIVKHVFKHGTLKHNRTGVDTISTFNYNYTIDLRQGFPLLTTKKINWKSIVVENLWFLSGNHHIDFLHKFGIKFWDAWADKRGYLPEAYGRYWRKCPAEGFNVPGEFVVETRYFDQFKALLCELIKNRNSRRLILTSWYPPSAYFSNLPPCHFTSVFNVQYDSETYEPYLNLHLTQRSCDVAVGLPFNIAGYAFLLELVSTLVGIPARYFSHSIVDLHVYTNHIDGLVEQLQRAPRSLPRLDIKKSIRSETKNPAEVLDQIIAESKDWDDVKRMFQLDCYNPHPFIKFDVAV